MKPARGVGALCLPLLLLLAFSTSCSTEVGPDAGQSPVQGISHDEIVLGSSCALTGHASFLGTHTIRGALAYFNHINEQGGIHGRRIRLVVRDDLYDPSLCVANTQALLNEDKVFALTSYVGTATAVKIIPIVEGAGVPLVGLFTGAHALREPFRRYIINIRASYHEETGEAVRYLVEEGGFKEFAVFYQYDAFGLDGLTGAELALKRYGLWPVAKGSYIRGTLDVEEAVQQVTDSDARVVVMIGTYGPSATFIRQAKQIKPDLVFYNVSFVGSEQLLEELGADAEGLIVSQVVPPPSETALLPAAEEYNRLLARYFPDDSPSFVGFEGFINAKVMVEGLRRAGPGPTREKLIHAIETIHQFSVGIAHPVNYNSSRHQGLDRVFLTEARNGKFLLLTTGDQFKKERAVLGATPTEIIPGQTQHSAFDIARPAQGVLR